MVLERLAMAAAARSGHHRRRHQRQGSVSAYCAAILSAAGIRVGTFTSPHLRDYRERIRVHDRWASAAELAWLAFEKNRSGRHARRSVALTFFEFNALAALLIFEAAGLDAWVLEIGMGGRLDAVNVVDPAVAVVASIGLDHQEYLGETLEAIAREKAGIFRPGKTAVIGGREPPWCSRSIARSFNSPLKRLGHRIQLHSRGRTGWRYRRNALGPAATCRRRRCEGTFNSPMPRPPWRRSRKSPAWIYPPPQLRGDSTEVRLAARFQVIDARAGAGLGIGCRAQSRTRRGCWRAI